MKLWWQAFRPKTLTAAVLPVFVGAAFVAARGGQVSWILLVFVLASALCIQIGTNLVNDALDFKKGADTSARLGPARVTASGAMSASQVMRASYLTFFMSVLFAIPLIAIGGWPILVVGLASLVCAYLYTGGPYPLAYHGLGEIFVLIFFGLVATAGTAYLLSGHFESWSLLAGLQVGLLSTLLIAINNYRDMDEDRRSGKRTLVARFGASFARVEIVFLCFAPFALQVCWLNYKAENYPNAWALLLPFLALPLAFYLARSLWNSSPGRHFNAFLGQSALLHLFFGGLLALSLLLY